MTEEEKPPETEDTKEDKPRPASVSKKEWDNKVEFTPEQQARFNRLYGQVKTQDTLIKKMAADNAKLVERLDNLDAATAKREIDSRLGELRTAEKEALESGDYDRASQVRDQMTELRVDAAKPKEVPKPQSTDPDEWIDGDKEAAIAEFASETDEEGNPLRPWCAEDHPDRPMMLEFISDVIKGNPDIEVEELLKKADRYGKRLVQKPVRTAAAVLSGNSDVRPQKRDKVSLSEDQKAVARKMYPGDPKALERYAKAVERHGL